MSAMELAERLEEIVLRRLAEDRLVLPAAPAVMSKLLAQLQQPNAALKGASAIVAQEPLLAAQLIRLASAAAGGAGGVRTVEQAVTRLGAQRLKGLALELGARKLFDSRDPRIAALSRGLWEHSLAVALMARDLAALCGSPDGETPYMAGLLHDIGKPVIGGLLLEAERLLASSRPRAAWFDADTWLDAIQRSHRRVGVALAERWGLPESVVGAIRECGDFDPTDRHAPSNFVRFANAVAKERELYVGSVDRDDNGALIMIGRSLLGIDDEVLGRLSTDLRVRVKVALDS